MECSESQPEIAAFSLKQRFKERIGIWGIGFLGNKIMVYGGDYVLYPYVIYSLGVVKGGVLMSVISFLLCLGTIKFYDWAKLDLLGIETVKDFVASGGVSRTGRAMVWLLRKGDAVALVVLSLYADPFITTAYLRRGSYNGLSRRDWKIFIVSWVISNLFWIATIAGGITFLKFAFSQL